MAQLRGCSAFDAVAARVKQNVLYSWGATPEAAGSAAGAVGARPTVVGLALEATSMGTDHGAAVDADGRLVMWGEDAQGQLGLTFDQGGDFREAETGNAAGATTSKKAKAGNKAAAPAATDAPGADALVRPAPRLDTFVHGTLLKDQRQPRGQPRLPFVHPYFAAPETPRSPLPARPVRCVACGHRYTLVTLRGESGLYAWGANDSAQLGFGDIRERRRPERVVATKIENVTLVKLSAGAFHAAAIDDTGTCWTWGRGTSGELGRITTVSHGAPAEVKGGLSNVVDISCGFDHCAAVTAQGRVFCWGSNAHGQCAVNDAPELVTSPAAVKAFFGMGPFAKMGTSGGNDLRIVQAVAGTNVTAFVDEHGHVFMCGEEVAARVLVSGPDEKPKYAPVATKYNMVIPDASAARAVGLLSWLSDDHVKGVALSETHAAAVHKKLSVPFCWGNALENRFGVATGDRDIRERTMPGGTHTEAFSVHYASPKGFGLECRKVLKVACGKSNTAALCCEEPYVPSTAEFLLCVRLIVALQARLNRHDAAMVAIDDACMKPFDNESDFSEAPICLTQWMLMLREAGVLGNLFDGNDAVAIFDAAIEIEEGKRVDGVKRKFKETLKAFDDELQLMTYEDEEELKEIEEQYGDAQMAPRNVMEEYESRKQDRADRREELLRQRENFHQSAKLDVNWQRPLNEGIGLELALFFLAARLDAPDLERDVCSWYLPSNPAKAPSPSPAEASSPNGATKGAMSIRKSFRAIKQANVSMMKSSLPAVAKSVRRLPSVLDSASLDLDDAVDDDLPAGTLEKADLWAREVSLGGRQPGIRAMLLAKLRGTAGQGNGTGGNGDDVRTSTSSLGLKRLALLGPQSGEQREHRISRVDELSNIVGDSWIRQATHSLALARYQRDPPGFVLSKEEREILGDTEDFTFESVDKAPPKSEWPLRLFVASALVPTIEKRIENDLRFSPLIRAAYVAPIRRFLEEPETRQLLMQVWLYLQKSNIADTLTAKEFMELRKKGGVMLGGAEQYLSWSYFGIREYIAEDDTVIGPTYKSFLALIREAELVPKKVLGTRKSESFAPIDRHVALREQKEMNAHKALRIAYMGKYPSRGFRFPREGVQERNLSFIEFQELLVNCALMWPLRRKGRKHPDGTMKLETLESSAMYEGLDEQNEALVIADDDSSDDEEWVAFSQGVSRPGTRPATRPGSPTFRMSSIQQGQRDGGDDAIKRMRDQKRAIKLSRMFSNQHLRSKEWYRSSKTSDFVLDITDNVAYKKGEENVKFFSAEEASRHKLRPLSPEAAFADAIGVDGDPTLPLQRMQHLVRRLNSWRSRLVDPAKGGGNHLRTVEELNKEVFKAFGVYCGLGESTHRIDLDQGRWRRFCRDIKVADGYSIDLTTLDGLFNEISREHVGFSKDRSSVNAQMRAELSSRTGALHETWDEADTRQREQEELIEQARASTAVVQGSVEVSKESRKLVEKYGEQVGSEGVKEKDVGRGVVKAALDSDQFRGALTRLALLKYQPIPLRIQKPKLNEVGDLIQGDEEMTEEEREQEQLEEEMHLAARVMGMGNPISAEESYRWLVELHVLPAVTEALERYDRYVGQLNDAEVGNLVKEREESIKRLFIHYAKLDASMGYSAAETRWELLQSADTTMSYREMLELMKDKEVVPKLITMREVEMSFRRANFGDQISTAGKPGSTDDAKVEAETQPADDADPTRPPSVDPTKVDAEAMASGLQTKSTDENYHDLTLIEFVGALGIISQVAFAEDKTCDTAADRLEKLLDALGCFPPKPKSEDMMVEEEEEQVDPYAKWWGLLPMIRAFAEGEDSKIWYYANSSTMRAPMLREVVQAPLDLPQSLRASIELAQSYLARGLSEDARSIIDAVETSWSEEFKTRGLSVDGYITPQGKLFLTLLRGSMLECAGRFEEVVEMHKNALADLVPHLNSSSPDSLILYGCLGRAYLHMRLYERAFVSCVYHLVGLEAIVPGPRGVEAASARANLAIIVDICGDAKIAVHELRSSLDDLTAALGETHPRVRAVAMTLERVLHKRFNSESAGIPKPLGGPSEAQRLRALMGQAPGPHYEPVVYLKPKERAELGLPPLVENAKKVKQAVTGRDGARSTTPTTGMRRGGMKMPSPAPPAPGTTGKRRKPVKNPTFDDPLVEILAEGEKCRAWRDNLKALTYVSEGYGGGSACLRTKKSSATPLARRAPAWAAPDPSVPPPPGVTPAPPGPDPREELERAEAVRRAELETFDEDLYKPRLREEYVKSEKVKTFLAAKEAERAKKRAEKAKLVQKMGSKQKH